MNLKNQSLRQERKQMKLLFLLFISGTAASGTEVKSLLDVISEKKIIPKFYNSLNFESLAVTE